MKSIHIFDHHHYHHTLQDQIGHGIPVYTGYRQRGGGLGSIFGFIKKYAIPVISKYILPHAKSALINTVSDVSQGQSIKSALKNNAMSMVKNVSKGIVQPQSGAGLHGIKRVGEETDHSFHNKKSKCHKVSHQQITKKIRLKTKKRKKDNRIKSKRDIFG